MQIKTLNSKKTYKKLDSLPHLKPIEQIKSIVVSVNNLRVREGQLKSSNVVDKLKEGTLVYSKGEESNIAEKAILRSIMIILK